MPATNQSAVSTLIREVLADPDLARRASSGVCPRAGPRGPGRRRGPAGIATTLRDAPAPLRPGRRDVHFALERAVPTARKWSEQESATMSPLNNLPGRRRHDMRDAVPSCGTIDGAGRQAGARGNCRHTKRRTLVPARRPGGSPTALIRVRRRRGASAVVRVGLLGRLGAGSCPNLLQRRPGPGSAARRSAEYQRFSSVVPARSGPLQQIWTTCAPAGPSGRAAARRMATTTGTPTREHVT